MTDARITLRFDGGSRGNPGPAAVGVVLETDDGTPVVSVGRFIGRATNNVAEYSALVVGLREAKKFGVRNLRVLGDSELVIKQLLGEYRVKNETLRPLYQQAVTLLAEFDKTEIGHNRRGHNTLADVLANLALDKQQEVTEADLPAGGAEAYSRDAGDEVPPDGAAGPESYECPRCGCVMSVTKSGEVPVSPRKFMCRCGTPMRPR